MLRYNLGRGLLVVLATACGDAANGAATGTAGAAGTAVDAGGDMGAAGAGGGGGAGGDGAADAGTDPVEMVEQGPVDKVDLLFMIDNSRSMSDKHELLQAVLPDFVSRLVNPFCLDASGQPFPPPGLGADCPAGQRREFTPLADVHIGVISSSLGDAGANVACPSQGFPEYLPDRIDLAHLVGSLPRAQGTSDNAEGYLTWRAGDTSLSELTQGFQRMVLDTGERGCGWEASLESWLRFLVDPFPYQELVRVPCPGSTSTAPNCVQQATDGDDRVLLDETLLAQRAAFLRPDSLVAIVMLTDENDCSIQIGNQSWVVAAIDDPRPMFRSSSTCAEDANAKCCFSCPLGPPDGCASDPICNEDAAGDVLQDRLPANEDGLNLRCFQQKRRFGVDFLYPTERYVNALRNAEICWNDQALSTESCAVGDIVDNPLYAGGRSRDRVFLAGILGVPWQAIASANQADGRPLGAGQLRFQDATELAALGTWAQILGSPGVPWRPATSERGEVSSVPATPPTLPYMVESDAPRPGVTAGNAVNGREQDTIGDNESGAPNDLQYACIFPLATPKDCAALDPANDECECFASDLDRPLCEQTPGVSAPGTTQYWGKAYPAARQLEVLERYGANSVVASICARNVTDATSPDFAHRPALTALIERIREQLP